MSHNQISVTIRGICYPSREAAARAVGVSAGAVARAQAAGRLDRLGLALAAGARRGAETSDLDILIKRGGYSTDEARAILSRPRVRIRAVPPSLARDRARGGS